MNKMEVLVIDDEEINRFLYCELFKNMAPGKVNARAAIYADEVITACNEKRPDVVLLDCNWDKCDNKDRLIAVEVRAECPQQGLAILKVIKEIIAPEEFAAIKIIVIGDAKKGNVDYSGHYRSQGVNVMFWGKYDLREKLTRTPEEVLKKLRE